jgi:hypothetical protein
VFLSRYSPGAKEKTTTTKVRLFVGIRTGRLPNTKSPGQIRNLDHESFRPNSSPFTIHDKRSTSFYVMSAMQMITPEEIGLYFDGNALQPPCEVLLRY